MVVEFHNQKVLSYGVAKVGNQAGSKASIIIWRVPMLMRLKAGNQYIRSEIHDHFRGSRQAGICQCQNHPFTLLFSTSGGNKYGYEDGWNSDQSVYLYTGQGKIGDQQWNHYNRAVRDHVELGNSLLLFEGASGRVTYIGEFVMAHWSTRRLIGEDGELRDAFVFHLVPNHMVSEDDTSFVYDDSNLTPGMHEQAPLLREEHRFVHGRRAKVKEAVLNRAKGKCEYSGKPAPFTKHDGTPFLEVHHVRMLSEGGNDHERYCVAISPDVHREIHYGVNGQAINEQLSQFLKRHYED